MSDTVPSILRASRESRGPRPSGRSAAGEAPLVSLAGVSKSFKNGVVALAQLDLDVREGEFLSLLGPSGCGKSTALRLVAGLERPSAGRIAWGEVAKGARGRPSIGFVFQDPTLMPWASVEQNVFLPLRLEGSSFRDAQARIGEALELVGLADFRKAMPRELSGGMRMRVSIARALVTRPSLLLMDEPFAALDEITRFKLNDDLMRLKEEIGCTVIFVTHSIYESAYLSTRIAVMAARPGRIIAEIAIDAALPRSEAFRREPTYLEACAAASDALHGALDPMDHR
jgi:NitT/TauT family transport system ATP-binding protein